VPVSRAVVSAIAWLVLSTVLYHCFLCCFPTIKDGDDDDDENYYSRSINGLPTILGRSV